MLCSIVTELWGPLPSCFALSSTGTATTATDTTGHHLNHVPAVSRAWRLPKDLLLPHFCS